MRRTSLTITGAIVVAISLTAVARADRGAQTADARMTPRDAINAIHASPATWGRAGRPDYADIAFAPDGTMYAVDALNGRVYKVTGAGQYGRTRVVAGSGPGVNLEGSFQTWERIPLHGWITVGDYGGDGQHGTDALVS